MARGTIEHANLSVSDIERSSEFFQRLLGWRERWSGPGSEDAAISVAGPWLAHMAKAVVAVLGIAVPPESDAAVHELTTEALAGLLPPGSLG